MLVLLVTRSLWNQTTELSKKQPTIDPPSDKSIYQAEVLLILVFTVLILALVAIIRLESNFIRSDITPKYDWTSWTSGNRPQLVEP